MTPPAPEAPPDRAERARRLREVAWVFLRLGTTAFGGPAAHVALMEAELVRRRRWLDHAEFLDLLGASNLIPGPSSTELALHLGHRRAGWAGMALAGLGFILPAALMVTGLAALYVRFGALPVSAGLLAGVKAVLIAVVLQALRMLGKAAVKSWGLALLGVASVVAQLLGVAEIVVLLAAGAVALIASRARPHAVAVLVPLPALVPAALPLAGTAPTLGGLFLAFVKIGALVFGSGYVLLAFLRAELVVARGWIDEQQLLDAVAIGQVTPGPVFTAASFIGYLVAGGWGAAIATAGIFLPAVVAVALSGPLVPRLRASPAAGAFLDGVNVASLALMAVVTVQLARAALVDLPTVGLALASAVLLFATKLHPGWLVGVGAAVGLVRTFVG